MANLGEQLPPGPYYNDPIETVVFDHELLVPAAGDKDTLRRMRQVVSEFNNNHEDKGVPGIPSKQYQPNPKGKWLYEYHMAIMLDETKWARLPMYDEYLQHRAQFEDSSAAMA